MRLSIAIAGSIVVAGCVGTRPSTRATLPPFAGRVRSTLIDDARTGDTPEHFSYVGHWEHVRDRHDGRIDGTSTRSWHAGDNVIFTYIGFGLLVYGVTGPNGGNAAVSIDGVYQGTANFYSSQVRTHRLVFTAPPLAEGVHTIGLVVSHTPNYPHRNYVNIDSVTVLQNQ